MNKFFLFVLCLLLSLFPQRAEGTEIIIKNNSKTGEYLLNTTLFINTNDVLRIESGTKLKVEEYGYIFSKGKVIIGSEQANVSKVTIFSSSSRPFVQLSGSEGNFQNFDFIGTSFLEMYGNSKANINNAKLTYQKALITPSPFITVFQNSELTIGSSTMADKNESQIYPGTTLIEVYASSSLKVLNSKVYSPSARSVISVYQKSSADFSKLNIFSCKTWFMIFDNSSGSGEVSGPDCSTEPQRVFNNSTSSVIFSDTSCCSSVLFIPGLQGSRLYKRQILENQLWEPNRSLDIEKLFLSSMGISLDSAVYPKDVILKTNILGNIGSVRIYESISLMLRSMKDRHFITDFNLFAYDWRKNPQEIVEDGLIEKLERLAAESDNGKVSIIAHSYGGLVAKDLLHKLILSDRKYLIDEVILVAVPESGAPAPIFTLSHGYTDSSLINFFSDQQEILNWSNNMPSVYNLLPSQSFGDEMYLKLNIAGSSDQHSIKLESKSDIVKGISSWLKHLIAQEESKPKKKSMLKVNVSQGRGLDPKSLILSTSTNNYLLQRSDEYKEYMAIKNQLINDSFKIWSIVGTGIQTLSGMSYFYKPCTIGICSYTGLLTSAPLMSTNGDGTVIFDTTDNRSGKILQVDLSKLNSLHQTNYSHANILESPDILYSIEKLISSDDTTGGIYEAGLVSSKELFTVGVSGDVQGGMVVVLGTTTLRSEIVSAEPNFSYIDQIPNTIFTRIGNDVFITSQMIPDKISFLSNASQRLKFLYGNGSAYWDTPPSQFPKGNMFAIDNVAVKQGSIITIDNGTSSATSTVSIDHDGDGVPDVIIPVNPATTTVPVATTTPGMLLTDLNSLINELSIAQNIMQSLQIYSYRQTYGRTIYVATPVFESVRGRVASSSPLKAEKLTGNELSAIITQLAWIQDSVAQMLEFDQFYARQLRQLEKLSSAERANALARREDLGRAFLGMSHLEDLLLEFIEKHGTI